MGNLRQKYDDQEWEALVEQSKEITPKMIWNSDKMGGVKELIEKSKRPSSEELFYTNLIKTVENVLINDPNFKGTLHELSFYERENKIHYGLFKDKAQVILEEIEKTKHLILDL